MKLVSDHDQPMVRRGFSARVGIPASTDNGFCHNPVSASPASSSGAHTSAPRVPIRNRKWSPT
jgi:hypothetical protein